MVSTVWKLEILLEGFAKVPEALRNCEVNALITDSRQVEPGALFIALAGQTQNGADYIDQALQRGAVAVLQESGSIVHEVVIAMPQLRRQLGQIASRFYDHPSQQLKIAAVTGTDGKSSVSHFIAAAMERLEGRAAVLGTLGNRMCSGVSLSAAGAHTTPPPIELQKLLAEVAAAGGRSVALEASSHGIEQSRLAGTKVNCAVLTQLGRDHLDYHGTMEAYAAAKQALFEEPGLESLVLNLDDALGRTINAQVAPLKNVIGYSLKERSADLYAQLVTQDQNGLQLEFHYQGSSERCNSPLYGRFNGSNLLATLGVLLCWKFPFSQAVEALQQIPAVDGRMEPFHPRSVADPILVVDYAHTPGALNSALQATRAHLQQQDGELWVVFGCGGDRDRGKRPKMGAVAEQGAERVVVTNDNPRTEPPVVIIEEILTGMSTPQQALVIEDRAAAIRYAFEHAAENDVILVAGKGHETTQVVGERTIEWSDRVLAAELSGQELKV